MTVTQTRLVTALALGLIPLASMSFAAESQQVAAVSVAGSGESILAAKANTKITIETTADTAAAEHREEAGDTGALLFVFVLSAFIGLGVIGRVSRLLHTPLMSLTNAISAIAVVGSILVVGKEHPTGIRILGAIALFASMTNIVSGFLLTDRMLKMFKQTRQPEKP